jgi:hypothetical protein
MAAQQVKWPQPQVCTPARHAPLESIQVSVSIKASRTIRNVSIAQRVNLQEASTLRVHARFVLQGR